MHWKPPEVQRLSEQETGPWPSPLRDSGFTGFEDVYGGKRETAAEPPAVPPGPAAALRVVCAVAVELGGLSKKVVQLDPGERSPELAQLAAEILDLVREPSSSGVVAQNLADGLAKVARGELAPETFRLAFHRKPAKAADGFLLRLAGRTSVSRGYDPARGYGAPRELTLGHTEFHQLLSEIAALVPGELPINLYSPEYATLSLGVLNREHRVQAQAFAGTDRRTHGERQEAFDLLSDLMLNLHLRVAADGAQVQDGDS